MHLRRSPLRTAILTALTVMNSGLASAALEEVVVTAQKREQSLQDTPIAISAFNQSDIEAMGITDVADVGAFAPNVKIAETPANSTGATIGIRGSVTINPALTWEPTVGIYLDGVFLGKNIGGIFDIAELERVEVLRGPQGTLYGKNTVGGAVNLITRKPSGELSGHVGVTLGNFDLRTYSASIDSPQMGPVRANLSLQRSTRDPLYSATATSAVDGFKDVDSFSGRLALEADLSENFTVSYAYDYSDKDQLPTLGQLTYVDTAQVPGLLPYMTADDERASRGMTDQRIYEKSTVDGHALTLAYQLGNMELKSITSVRSMEWKDLIDIDGSDQDYFNSRRDIDYTQRSQEFQLVGSTDSTQYVMGLYYFDEEAEVANPISFFGFGGFGFPTANNGYDFDNQSYALFGQVDWVPQLSALQQRLTLTLGVRWTEEEKEVGMYHPAPQAFGGQVFDVTADDRWSNFSPSLVANWAIDDHSSVYAKVSSGWKSGGFNSEAPTSAAFFEGYDPEKVRAYELGLKSEWLDSRLRVNAAAFYNDVEDMQFSIFLADGSASSNVANAGEATVQGFELEVVAVPTDSLTLSLNYGYLDAKYDSFIDNDPISGLPTEVKGQRDFPYSPRHDLSASIEYEVCQCSYGILTGRLDWSYNDNYVPYTNPSQNATSQIDSYALLNGRLTLSEIPLSGDQRLTVSAWGKNLLDEEYRVNTIPFGIWTTSYFGDPRTYGLDVRLDF